MFVSVIMIRFLSLGALFAFVLSIAPALAQERALTLGEVLELALERNHAVVLARNDVEIARRNHAIGNANLLPRATLVASQSGLLAESGQSPALSGAGRHGAGMRMSWRLFDGFGQFATYDRLGAQHGAVAAEAERVIVNTLADVTTAYYDIARQQQHRRVLEHAVELSGERMRIAEVRRDLGSASDLEVRRARAALNEDRAALLRHKVTLADARVRLSMLVGGLEEREFAVADSIALGRPPAREDVAARARQFNPALSAASERLLVARAARREIAAERFPTLDATAGYDYLRYGEVFGPTAGSHALDLTYGLSASLTVFDGFNRSRRIQNATVAERSAEVVIDEVRTRLDVEVMNLYDTYLNRVELIELERENLEITQANVDVAMERFRLGTITSVELREVQETLIRARSRLIDAAFEAKRAETDILRLTGGAVGE
jgi:outer membrane protein